MVNPLTALAYNISSEGSIFSSAIKNLISILRVWMKILSHANAKKKKKKKKGLKIQNIALLLVVFN